MKLNLLFYGNCLPFSGNKNHERNVRDSERKSKDDFPIWKQAIATLGSAMVTFSAGFTMGYSAVILPQIGNDTNPIKVDENLGSWIASVSPLSMAMGCLIAGYLTDGLGRRNSHISLAAPFVFGWLLIAFGTNIHMLLAGRCFTGLCAGAVRPIAVVFLGEVTDPKYRGVFLFCSSLAMNTGVMVVHILGTYLHWTLTAGLCAISPILGLFIMICLPESPTWLINKGKTDLGVSAFTWYRGTSEVAQTEVRSIVEKHSQKPILTFKNMLTIVFSREFMKPFFTSCIMFITVQFCGINIIPFYAIDILAKTIGNIEPFLSMIIIDLIRFSGSIAICIMGKKLPRKRTFIVCSMGTALSLFLLVTYLYIKPGGFVWIPLVCMIVYTALSSAGIVTLSWSFLAEIFPARVRGLGSGLSSCLSYLLLFLSVKSTPAALAQYGEKWVYLMFGLVTFICACALCFLLPETKGKSLQEIEDDYSKEKDSSF